jgi:cation transport ATPase
MAIEATGITFISGSLADVVSAIALPRATMRNAQTGCRCGRPPARFEGA